VTHPGVAAAQRAGSALARARELSARLDDLRAGQPVEAFDSERAAQLADLLDTLGHHERAAPPAAPAVGH